MSAQRDTLYKSVYASCMGKKVIRILPELKHNGKTNSIIQYTAYDMVYANVMFDKVHLLCMLCVCSVHFYLLSFPHTHNAQSIKVNPKIIILLRESAEMIEIQFKCTCRGKIRWRSVMASLYHLNAWGTGLYVCAEGVFILLIGIIVAIQNIVYSLCTLIFGNDNKKLMKGTGQQKVALTG